MSKVQNFFRTIGRHKYVVTIAVFLLIICFLDQNNLMLRWQHRQERLSLQKEIEYYEAMRDSSVQGLKNLMFNGANLERVAREKYGMHLSNEEVFIIQ
jgi:cell division protein FtsB